MPVEEARERILALVAPVAGTEWVPLQQAPGRVLARDLAAPIDVPAFDNSAMDGYALRHADLDADSPLQVVGRALAGAPWKGRVGAGQAVRIMTGAVMPEGADTVVMQEQVTESDGRIRIEGEHVPGENVRRAGEDIRRGETVLGAGRRLNVADVGMLASIGIDALPVRRRVRAAFFSTGDELVPPGRPLAPGQIHDSNRHVLRALLQGLGTVPLDLGLVPDEPAAVEAALRRGAEEADAVLTSGGVSVGEADHVTEALRRLGEVGFWRVAIKPGKPLAFGRIGGARFFGLPGNPVSSFVTFCLLARPFILKCQGMDGVEGGRPRFRKRPGRADYQRGVLTRAADGTLEVAPTGPQGSHVLTSMARADCLVALPRESGDVEPGTWVEVLPFRGLMPCGGAA